MTDQTERERVIVAQLKEDARRHSDLATGGSLMGKDYHAGYYNGLSRAIELIEASRDHMKGQPDD